MTITTECISAVHEMHGKRIYAADLPRVDVYPIYEDGDAAKPILRYVISWGCHRDQSLEQFNLFSRVCNLAVSTYLDLTSKYVGKP